MFSTKELAASSRQSPLGQPRDMDGAREPAGATAQNVGQNCLSTASLALLAAAIGQIGEVIVITDISATIQYVNPAFTRITGYSAEEAIGQNTRLLKSDRQNPAYYRELWKTILAGEVWLGELINRRKDGTLYTAEMSITPVRDPSGAIANFIAINQDVTEHRATEAALQSGEKRLEDAQHITPLGGWELDEQASEFRGSAGFLRIFDYPPSAVAIPFGKVMDAIPTADRERFDKTLKNTLQTHEPFDVEHRVVRRDGTMRVVRSRGQVVSGQDGRSARLVGTSHDITDFRLAHEKLRQSEEKFRSLVANIPAVIWSSNVHGQTQYISPNAEPVFGFTADEMCEKGAELWFERIHPSDSSRIVRAFHQLFAEGRPFDVEYRVQRKDGQWIWVHDRAYRTYERNGIRCADGIVSDISERKRAERYQHLSAEILGALNEPLGVPDVVNHILMAIKRETGLDAVAIRLRSGDDFPYFVQSGFSPEFLSTENSLIAREKNDGPCRDEKGNISLECTCGLVISGKTDPANPLFTKGGSCWTNDSLPLLDLPANQDPRLHPRNVCIHQGYCSVALIPIRAGGDIVGLLQLNDRKKNCFTLETIQFFEGLSASIGVALMRKQQEDALRASEKRYRLLFERNLAGVLRSTLGGRALDCNQAGARMLGYDSPEEVLALPMTDLYHKSSDREAVLAELKRAKSITNYELKFRRKDGNPVWLIGNMNLIEDDSGDGGIVEGTLVDITERKRAEEMHERLAAVVESSDDAIISKTLDGIITAWNSGAEKLFGYSSWETLGKPVGMLLPPERAQEESEILARIGSGERVDHFETVRVRKDGKRIDISATISPIKDSSGAIVGASKIARDITERKRAEEEMRKAKEAAEGANRAKSQFLANMSHEIRTPMNGVIGMAGLLLDTELTPEQRQYAGIVRSSGEALLKVINDILDFSKIEARKLTLETTDFDLHTVLEDAAAVLAINASEKGLELTCELEPGTPRLLQGDPGRVRQVLLNLLGNAVKFTAQGEVAVRVRLEAEDARTATLRFTVRDTGIGFRQDRASALFERFVQADGSSTRRYGGTGLGLTISKQLVEMMGGRIGVESEEGKGSTFWFTAVFRKQPQKQPQPSVPVTGVPPGLRDAKVLVVDANTTNQSLVSRLLSSWGCRPETSADGDSALAILRQAAQGADPFQIALLDMSLPGMGAEELGRRIAADPQLQHTALLSMSGLGRQTDAASLHALGFAGHIFKPIWERTLREALLALGAKGSGAAPFAASAGPQPSVVRNSHARILVAEDNLTNQHVAVAILRKLGYDADVVADGKQAVRALQQADYDVVLMDCEMPELDGYEASRRIREPRTGTRNPHIPIIAITADAISGDRDRCLQAGMSDYLAKPVEPRQLADALAKWLNLPAGGEASPPAGQSPAKAEVVFNREDLLARLMGDKDLASRVIAGFLDDAPRQLRALKNRLEEGDADGARLQAHTLKGAAATVSAESLRALCSEAQEAAASSELSRALVLVPRLEEEFELLKATLKQSGWA